ncbi:threonine--tRNA ligase, mitochondrial 1-like protein [Tanacetum coccineum]|uniref:Threonine--tRNA ligase, mitochondrial 1-like protein n=1 Tax=Tanacetum coccineum TaxID=301880 RepID=A0ABQ5ESM5_9ASTR
MLAIPIGVTLSDGTVKEGKKWETTPFDIAKELSKSLASNALISRVNGALWDMSRPLESDCQLKIFTFDSDEGRDTFWHSSAHILGQALEQTYGCKLCIGPCTTRGEAKEESLNDRVGHESDAVVQARAYTQ